MAYSHCLEPAARPVHGKPRAGCRSSGDLIAYARRKDRHPAVVVQKAVRAIRSHPQGRNASRKIREVPSIMRDGGPFTLIGHS